MRGSEGGNLYLTTKGSIEKEKEHPISSDGQYICNTPGLLKC